MTEQGCKTDKMNTVSARESIVELDLHVTNRCNLRCCYCCYNSGSMDLPEMSTMEIAKTLEDARGCGLESLHINGGEPLLRDDIAEIVRIAVGLGLDVRLQTNGTLLTDELTAHLRVAGLRKLMISLDGSTAQTNDALRASGVFAGVTRSIRMAVSAGFDLRVNAIATTLNASDLLQTADMAFSLGAQAFSFYYFSPIGRGAARRDLWVTPKEWILLVKQFRAEGKDLLSRYHGRDLFCEVGYAEPDTITFIDPATLRKCGAGCARLAAAHDYMIVRCDGEAFPCILFVNHREFLGNVRNRGFEAVWRHSPGWSRLDVSMKRSECQQCKLADVCSGGCLGYATAFGTQIDTRCVRGEIAPLCPIAKYTVTYDRFAGASDDVMGSEDLG